MRERFLKVKSTGVCLVRKAFLIAAVPTESNISLLAKMKNMKLYSVCSESTQS
jgi:hypothetical protein